MMKKQVERLLNSATGQKFSVHKSFFRVFDRAKSEKLYSLFPKELIVEKPFSYEKSLSDRASEVKSQMLDWKLHHLLLDASKTEDDIYTGVETAIEEMTNKYSLAENKISKDLSFILNGKKHKYQAGTKITKILKIFISSPKLLELWQNKLSRITNEKTVRGTLCLSIHPMDYLTVSDNDEGWTSCFNTLEGGEFQASVLSLWSSNNTIVAYLKSDREIEIGDGLKWNSKKWRSLITLSKDNNVLHFGMHYPYFNESLMNGCVEMLNELCGFNLQEDEDTRERGYVDIITPCNMYNDETQSVYTQEPIHDYKFIQISEEGSYCPCCGEHFDYWSRHLLCPECEEGYEQCIDCGEYYYSDSVNDEGYCDYC